MATPVQKSSLGDSKVEPQSTEGVVGIRNMENLIAELDATIFRCWARRREENLKLGHGFNELKKVLHHGKWKEHFEEVFAPHGISLRTAERYMKRAKREEAKVKNDKLTIFKLATDQRSQEIAAATQEAEEEVGAQPKTKNFKPVARLYYVPLHLADDERNAIDALRKSSEWTRVEKLIVRLLRQLWNQHTKGRKANQRRP